MDQKYWAMLLTAIDKSQFKEEQNYGDRSKPLSS